MQKQIPPLRCGMTTKRATAGTKDNGKDEGNGLAAVHT
jgi:hypothetical protein